MDGDAVIPAGEFDGDAAAVVVSVVVADADAIVDGVLVPVSLPVDEKLAVVVGESDGDADAAVVGDSVPESVPDRDDVSLADRVIDSVSLADRVIDGVSVVVSWRRRASCAAPTICARHDCVTVTPSHDTPAAL